MISELILVTAYLRTVVHVYLQRPLEKLQSTLVVFVHAETVPQHTPACMYVQ